MNGGVFVSGKNSNIKRSQVMTTGCSETRPIAMATMANIKLLFVCKKFFWLSSK